MKTQILNLVCAFLFLSLSRLHAGDGDVKLSHDLASAIAYNEFAYTQIDSKGHVANSVRKINYAPLESLPPDIKSLIRKLRPSISRADVQRSWEENGGLIPCEFFRSYKDGRLIAVRIQWRPSEMPASVAANRSKRIKWIEKHQPMPKATDILERVSLPFETQFVID